MTVPSYHDETNAAAARFEAENYAGACGPAWNTSPIGGGYRQKSLNRSGASSV
jgi:hypothetical protein